MLPYLIAGAIGFVVGKLFEEDEAPKYADGGNIDYSDFRTSVIGLMNDNKVLILQRGSTANWMPNKWSIVGGVIEEGEVPIESMIRECEEEIGLKPSNVSYDHKIMTTDSGEIYYFNGTLKSKNVKLDYENSAYKFISKDEIDNYDFVPYVKEFVLQIFSRNEKKNLYKSGGSVLLAPNGKPSNLTPEQYKLVREPAFKEWFGDWENDRENSGKVSGYTKEPIVFYHSTKSNFLSKKGENIFKNPPFFFSFKEDVSDYIVRIQHQNKKGRVFTKPFFLKYHNTFDLSQVKILKDKELTRLIKKHTFYQTESDIRLFELKLSLSKFRVNTWFLTENEDFQEYIKNKGYDSFVVYEDGDKNIAVFKPNQIKLADGTNTTFDGNNPDIRFDGGGEIKWNVDRYREVEKEMYELWKQGKSDTTEYFKLIKEKTILEQAKINQTNVSVLLAPNGKPSRLNEEQYELVRKPEFKAWFGDWENESTNASKVVDSNGEPLPVYHGTNAEPFVVFDGGSFFTDDYMNAEGYASGEMVYEVFLNIKNPLIINARGRKWDNLKNKYGNSTGDIVGQLDMNKYDGVIFNNINDNWFDDEMGDTQNVYFSINSNQIKLADGTNTTFDSNNPDIRFDGGGIVSIKKLLDFKLHEVQIDNEYAHANLSIEQLSDGEVSIYISEIWSDIQGEGYATKLLNKLKKMSNKLNVPLSLRASTSNNIQTSGGLNQQQLVEWYIKNGFRISEKDNNFETDSTAPFMVYNR
jgi:8-oxo-dGTP pyrophosphatase MutT (NUDIX family)